MRASSAGQGAPEATDSGAFPRLARGRVATGRDYAVRAPAKASRSSLRAYASRSPSAISAPMNPGSNSRELARAPPPWRALSAAERAPDRLGQLVQVRLRDRVERLRRL